MKKFFAVSIVLLLLFSLSACNVSNSNLNESGTTESSQSTTSDESFQNTSSLITQDNVNSGTTDIDDVSSDTNNAETPEITTAYDEYLKALQNTVTYEDLIEEMYFSLATAYTSGRLGTPTAIACIHGLVPESVYSNESSVSEKINAAYDYFRFDKLNHYFSAKYNSSGDIVSVDIKLGNLRKFIEDGLACDVFTGSSWTSFDLNPNIISIEQFAQKMNITQEVAMAFLEIMDSCDASWIDGESNGLLDTLLPQ